MEKKLAIYNSGTFCTENEYFSINAINSSTIKKFMDAFKKMKEEEYHLFINEDHTIIEKYFDVKEKYDYATMKNFAVGSIIHKLCLETEKFENQSEYKDYELFYNDILQKAMYSHANISDMDKDIIKRCYKSWCNHKFELEDPRIELAFFNSYKGMPIKGKIDMIGKKDEKIIVVDLKTIRCFKAVEDNIKRFYYWFQTLYYKLLLSYEENGQFVDIVDDIYLIFLSKSEEGIKIVKFSELAPNDKAKELSDFLKIVEMYNYYYCQKMKSKIE